ncbi:7-carboxy-7-deazaguanine synthase QueE [Rheinheimera baltica]|uniref:7-carboxy-7-deazaguanine synthase n=1 Tax=Rheinheimera baltica TaxID=67576 RepID=A0ABT9HYV5_9GAMM|nr:7-carboxy-7-deazaguanine synthase QueE [Rheinheimera baltica]MDP5136310.1 7-carboxy-7-deazaguanine synthase QueE [Rheinheimera baltica]MDP5144654.1 7-carboxy-7-deazaguanine synthase QueE [Rheinheimera baltica]MDP5190197.1 7-carboxy-7-deazaguanine synthase QueE [Rheinheimera baltica]
MYKVNEVFETIQGEGSFTGAAAIFIRLQGCPVGCSWCDTKHTWEVNDEQRLPLGDIVIKTAETEHWAGVSVEEILALFVKEGYQAKHVVITGGEPCMYDLNPLCEALHSKGYSTQIETSGTFEIKAPAKTWVTVSPKVNMAGGYKVLQSALDRANEIKHPVAMEKHIDELLRLLQQTDITAKLVYLQPISQQRRATELAIAMCKKYNWRLSVQVHKYLGIS